MKLAEHLAWLPSGRRTALSPDELTGYLRTRYRNDADLERRKQAKKRLDLYKDRGRRHFAEAIDKIYNNEEVRKWRKKFLEYAEFQNVTKRIIREISTVYSEPAQRTTGAKAADETYQLFQRVVKQDRKNRAVNRYGNLLNDVLVWPTVVPRMGQPYAEQRCITPDKFVAVAHPSDPTWPVAFIIDQFPQSVLVNENDPHYLVVAEEEFLWLDKSWRLVGSPVEHNLGRMPVLLWSREEREDCILDPTSGQDIVAAHMAVALLNAMMLKHQKAGTKIPVVSGDTSGMGRGQPMDEENFVEAPEGVVFTALDLGADPESYINATRAVIKQVAANYGIPESVFDLSYQATSGYEINLKRIGLREVRRDQIMDFRPFERELAELWSVVLTQGGHPLAFPYDLKTWSIQFGDTDAPDAPMDKLAYWEKLEELGLANRVEMYMMLNPEASEGEAKAAIEANLAMRVERMQRFQTANPGLFGPKESPNQPNDPAKNEDEGEDEDEEEGVAA
jgi:hypothetical protein